MRDATNDARPRDWRAEIAERLASLRLAPAEEADLADELSQHLEDRFRELRTRGMSDTEARRAVLEELDGEGSLASKLRDLVRRGTAPATLGTPARGSLFAQLRQDARSAVGAIGIMQLMPATGAELRVGDIHVAEPNIHAGAKYMDILMTRYFPDAHFSEGNRPLFAFASYNAGPGNIARVRKEAARRGLDPDKWFNNVELVVAEKIGIETTTYVRNIYKYYVSYKLTLEAQAARSEALKALAAPRS